MAVLAGSWSAGAQQPGTRGTKSQAGFAPPAMQQVNFRGAGFVRAPQVAVTNIRLSQVSWVDSSYDFTMTPFVQDVHVPVLSLAGGRFQLGGYYRMVSAENFQMGLPGGGSLPAWSIGVQSHIMVVAPQLDQGGGFSVSLHLHGAGLREMHCHAYQAVNHAIAFVRGS